MPATRSSQRRSGQRRCSRRRGLSHQRHAPGGKHGEGSLSVLDRSLQGCKRECSAGRTRCPALPSWKPCGVRPTRARARGGEQARMNKGLLSGDQRGRRESTHRRGPRAGGKRAVDGHQERLLFNFRPAAYRNTDFRVSRLFYLLCVTTTLLLQRGLAEPCAR